VAVDPDKTAFIVRAARDFIERQGAEALTLRALGREIGADPSVVYRHFADKGALLQAVGAALVAEIELGPAMVAAAPRERLRLAMTALRATLVENPGAGMILATGSHSPAGNDLELVRWGLGQLRELGLSGTNIAVGYQLLEGYTFGMATYDISSQPDPLEARRLWFRAVSLAEFDDVSRSTNQIAELNDHVFEIGLEAILDRLQALVDGQSD
jgi:AcrR family transcriptional regulator